MTVANKYAFLLLGESAKDNTIDQTEKELTILQQAIFLSPEILHFFKSPNRRSAKESMIAKVTTKYNISALVSNFMNQIIRNNRIELLPEIIESYNLLTDSKKLVEVISARRVEGVDKIAIEKIVHQTFGKDLEIKYKIQADLIGGMIMRCGNSRIDASITGMLKKAV